MMKIFVKFCDEGIELHCAACGTNVRGTWFDAKKAGFFSVYFNGQSTTFTCLTCGNADFRAEKCPLDCVHWTV